MKLFKLLSTSILFSLAILLGCRKDDSFRTDSNTQLAFTVDTLHFDTVFTQIGSATRFFKIKNNYSQSIKISHLYLENNANATFRLNVDGIAGLDFKDLQILPNDSLYVFAEVTVNPNAPISDSPFVIDANVVCVTNGTTQRMVLEAFGQNANYIPSRSSKGQLALLNAHGGTVIWDDKKPYVIYGVLFIDSTTLNIAPGTQIHVHGGLARTQDSSKTFYNDGFIYLLSHATINCMGTLAKPIVIQGDRLEKEFASDPGQWTGIVLGKGSKNNTVNYTTVKNAQLGIIVDSAADLTIKNSRLYNLNGNGLHGIHSKITAENCLIYNTGSSCVKVDFGGQYNFSYCTFAFYSKDGYALDATNYYCYQLDASGNCAQDQGFVYTPTIINTTNSILYGGKEDLISLRNPALKTNPNIVFNFNFNNCLFRLKTILDPTQASYYPNFLTNSPNSIQVTSSDKIFKAPSLENYHPDSLSIAFKKAIPISTIPTDIDGKPRDTNAPTIGCYETFK